MKITNLDPDAPAKLAAGTGGMGTPTGGDLSGPLPNPTVVAIQGVAIDATPGTTGDVLTLVDPTHADWEAPTGGTGFVTNTLGGKEAYETIAALGAAYTLDLANGNGFDATLTADCTLTFAGATTGTLCSFMLLLRQDGTGGWTTTWPGSVIWAGGTAPTLDTTASTAAVLTFFTLDGGAVWYGFPTGGGGGSTTLAGLTDVSLASLANADRLRYSTVDSKWHNSALIWRPVTVYDGTNWLPLVDGSGNAIMAEA